MRHQYPDAPRRRRTRSTADALACGLGCFSLALGAAQLLAPRAFARCLGAPGAAGLVRACGARELMTGVGILRSEDPSPWLWGRVAGDALDLALLGAALGGRRRRHVAAAGAGVAAVMALDVACARALAEAEAGHYVTPDYSDRSGFPKPPAEMRGAARDERDGQTG